MIKVNFKKLNENAVAPTYGTEAPTFMLAKAGRLQLKQGRLNLFTPVFLWKFPRVMPV